MSDIERKDQTPSATSPEARPAEGRPVEPPATAAETKQETAKGGKRADRETLHQLLRDMGRAAVHNWGFKLLALVVAIVLWAGLITQDPTLTREKTFTDVTISVAGEETMKRNGYIVVSDLDAQLSGARVQVEVPQMQYTAAQASNFNVRVDLSRITQTGEQEIKVLSTNSSTYGTVEEISPATLTVTVEEYTTRYRIPVTVNTVGETPAGYYASTPTLDPPLVAVSGPRSLVEKVSSALATLDLSKLPSREGILRTAVSFVLLDDAGEEIVSDQMQVTSESVLIDSVVVEQTLYPTAQLELSGMGLIQGTPAAGYEVKSVTVTPSVVTGAGRSDNLARLEELYPDGAVDVTGVSASFTEQVKVRKPSELTYLSSDSITVAVEIGPVIATRSFEGVRVVTAGVGEGLSAALTSRNVTVTVTGPQLEVEALKASALAVHCDATGLAAGTYELIPQVTISGTELTAMDIETIPATIGAEIKTK